MPVLACIGHWYLSLMYLAPVGLVGGGLWLKTRLEGHGEGGSPYDEEFDLDPGLDDDRDREPAGRL